ncbi:alpha/beta hydrolase [Phormidium tenue FACHB-886]|nr:alpha/beta hydrolase [Phormidium tenue FACHB-886]
MQLSKHLQTFWQRNRVVSTALLCGGLSCGLIEAVQLLEATSVVNPVVAQSNQPLPQAPVSLEIERNDFFVPSDLGIQIAVREVRSSHASRSPILLIHGGGPGGVASFDLNVPGYSLAADFAEAGHPVYIMNIRGWENSTRPDVLNQPPEKNPPAVTSHEAVRDIGAVVDVIQQRHQEPVALVGWATGGHWAGMYTSQNNEKVSHLVMLNSLYGVNAPWELRSSFEDPNNPGTFDASGGAYRLNDADGLIAQWSRTIPVEDKSQWRDPRVVEAYQQTALASDPTSETRNPASIRIPTAYRLESYNLSKGQKYWKAADITVPTLVMRGELDFWSRPEDLQALESELTNTPTAKTVTIPDGTHYLFNDRPERGRGRFVQEVLSFVASSAN